MNKLKLVSMIAIASVMFLTTSSLIAKERTKGRGTGPVIYVLSHDLYYDSILLTDLPPMKGRFQELVMTEDGPVTEFGPGDHDHVGGRWWVDANGNGEMDYGDAYFMCPLLGPGREEP